MEMGSSEAAPMEFDHGSKIIPATASGVSILGDFQRRQAEVNREEQLKRSGLSEAEICLYLESQATGSVERSKMEGGALQDKLNHIYSKVESVRNQNTDDNEKPGTSDSMTDKMYNTIDNNSKTFYPDQHPMNTIKDLEKDMFDHIKVDDITPITKRRKLLRRLSRKKESLDFDASKIGIKHFPISGANQNPNSLWDIKEVPKRTPPLPHVEIVKEKEEVDQCRSRKRIIGPRQQSRYTIKDNKIVRLEPVRTDESVEDQEYRAVDIVVPVNEAEERLLEGTKLSIDEIRSMDRFKHYEPGVPSKVLFLKNISPAASDEDISILFNQFLHENQAPIRVRLMSGRLRGQAFVHFQHENVAIQALEDVNGTVVKGRPVIAQFGKNCNNLQSDDR